VLVGETGSWEEVGTEEGSKRLDKSCCIIWWPFLHASLVAKGKW